MLLIVASAIKIKESGEVCTGVRHFSPDMRFNTGVGLVIGSELQVLNKELAKRFWELDENDKVVSIKDHIQGFLTSDLTFVDREQAWIIAREADQIRYSVRGESLNHLPTEGTLFSENIW